MKNIVYIFGCVLALCSCAGQYNIAGNSSVSTLDGRMLYLKVISHDDNMHAIDSSEVVHGKFGFMGMMDSAMMAELYMDDESVMPIVIENGDLSIRIDNAEQRVSGGSLNEKLYRFIAEKNLLDNELLELSHKEAYLIMNGEDPEAVHARLSEQADRLTKKMNKLEINFISHNYNNVLGAGVFMLICGQYPYPIITPQIETIMAKATPCFKSHPFVKEYMRAATMNMRQFNLMQTADKK